MTFNPTNPTGWNPGDPITADQMNDLDGKSVDAVDGVGGGEYDGELTFNNIIRIGNAVTNEIEVAASLVFTSGAFELLYPTPADNQQLVMPTGIYGYDLVNWGEAMGSSAYEQLTSSNSGLVWRMDVPAGAHIIAAGMTVNPPTGHSGVPSGTARPGFRVYAIDAYGGNDDVSSDYIYDPLAASVGDYETQHTFGESLDYWHIEGSTILIWVKGEGGPEQVMGGTYRPPYLIVETRRAYRR